MTRSDILDFLRLHSYAVQATNSADGAPQAALVGFVVDDRLQLFFDSFDSTRKAANLQRDPRITFVFGGHRTGDERTVQYEGVVDTPSSEELEELKRVYFRTHPDGLRRSQLAGITYFRVRPVWIRCTDLNVIPPRIQTFQGDIAGPAPPDPVQTPVGQAPQAPREPWQPQMDSKPLFNPFSKPGAGD